LKRIYGLFEAQFRQYFANAEKRKGVTGENLLSLLESRLDNVVYRLGFSLSRKQARMLVRQNHFLVNGKTVNIPSYLVDLEDVIEIKEKSRSIVQIQEAMERIDVRMLPDWLELEKALFKGIVRGRPTKASAALPVNEQLVVELYSR
jgi:small subunit ribosomal protein S4